MSADIKTWKERLHDAFGEEVTVGLGTFIKSIAFKYMTAEIADLRAALAAKTEGVAPIQADLMKEVYDFFGNYMVVNEMAQEDLRDEGVELLGRVIKAASKAAPSMAVEPAAVVWVRCHPDGTLTKEFLADAVIEPVRKNSGAWLPLGRIVPAAAVAVDADEDAYLIDKLGKLLAGVAVSLKGPEPALARWSYHDLPEIAAKLMLELELYRAMAAPAVQQGGEAAAEPDVSTAIEDAAKAMALHSGWDGWDTAKDCMHTPNGNEPDEEREYWRELAKIALKTAPKGAVK